jgi:hypothetical protein
MDILALRNKLTNGHDLSIQECEYLRSLMGAGDYPVKASAEIATDENGAVLWVERYTLSRIHGPRETFIKDSKTYEVLASKITYGAHGGALVEHVVKLVNWIP